jgi:hypothetical protein
MHKVHHLAFFSDIGPLAGELLGLVTSVNVVEDGKLGTKHEGEVADFCVANVDSEEVLVVEDHVTDPLVVRPATKARDRGDGTNVGEHENESTAGAGERLVVRGNLFGSDSLKQGFHVVVVGEDEGILLGVVGVDVAGGGSAELVSIVAFAVFGHVFGLGPARSSK